jgi:hypothetical protein
MGDLTPVAFLHSDFFECVDANRRTLTRAATVYGLEAGKTPVKGALTVAVANNDRTKRHVEKTINDRIDQLEQAIAAQKKDHESRIAALKKDLADLDVWRCVQVVALTNDFVDAVSFKFFRRTGKEAWGDVVAKCRNDEVFRKSVLDFVEETYKLSSVHWRALVAYRRDRNAVVHDLSARLGDFVTGLRTVATQRDDVYERRAMIQALLGLAAKKSFKREKLEGRYLERYGVALEERGEKRKANEDEATDARGAGPSRERPKRGRSGQ